MEKRPVHWKIVRDPYLRPLAERRGEAAVWDSGFFFDDDPDDAPLDDVHLGCTAPPRTPPTGPRPVVLLATGAFCPVHPGHLAMMERAREAARAAGYDVLGGYLSPGHDAYIQMKCGPAAIPASERLRRCAEAVAGTWLSVDPWEALHRRVAVNFTDVTARLRAWMRHHVDPRVEVLYVCGGDNARFALAFAEEGACVVVGRPGASEAYARWRHALADNPRVLWAEGDHPGASRAIRAPVWTPPPTPRLAIRVEDARAVRTLNLPTWRWFQTCILEALRMMVQIRTIGLDAPTEDDDVIGLDPMLPARHELALSRCYAPGGYEALGHVARPGSDALDAQVARIPDGRYVLRDDDRVTGNTLAAAKALLRPAQAIVDTRVAVAHDVDEDVADSRDFLLGADHGGLVLALPDGRLGRAPYALPYVDPAARCSVPAREAKRFSEVVWSLNARAFEATDLRVRHLPDAARAVVDFLGDDTPLVTVCRWHLDALARTHAPGAADQGSLGAGSAVVNRR